MKVLIVSEHFFPSLAIGSKRWSEFHLISKNYDIEFNVLTPIGGVSVGFVNTINEQEGDDVQPVIFQLGGNF